MQTEIETVVACSAQDIIGINLVPKEAGWLIVTYKNQVVIRSVSIDCWSTNVFFFVDSKLLHARHINIKIE
jgi:hypothetical protein